MSDERPCDWQTEYGVTMGRIVECGTPTANPSGWCDEHEHTARENYPHLPLPTLPRPE